MNEINIFMCCHKGYELIPPLCRPVQCGASLNPPVKGAVPDNTGDNISEKNREYCELTAHYFAWKNLKADYYGFCHYRRLFCGDERVKKPYLALKALPKSRLLGDESFWKKLIPQYDIIIPRAEDMGLSCREHYCTAKYHYAEDLELFLRILGEKAPELSETAESYLGQNRQYFCNMFIMSREYFFRYCEMLFPTLEEFDRRKNLHGDFQSDRTDGYLGELFTGIYTTYCKGQGARIKELPRLDICCSRKKRLSCALLPPESRRRFIAKKLVKKIRG